MRCKFVRLIYPKPEQHSPDGYMVAVYKPVEKVLDLNGQALSNVRVTGHYLPTAQCVQYDLSGQWVNGKYGVQYALQSYKEIIAPSKEGIVGYLSALVKGIGPKTAERIYHAFGTDTLNVLDQTPQKLLQVQGITPKKLEAIRQSYLEHCGERDLVATLLPYNIKPKKAVQIYKHFGHEALDIVRFHPYRLCEIHGIGFFTADEIAKSMGLGPLSDERIDAAILHALQQAESDGGHVCVTQHRLLSDTHVLLSTPQITDDAILSRVEFLLHQNQLAVYGSYLYRKPLAVMEDAVACSIASRTRLGVSVPDDTINRFWPDVQKEIGFLLHQEQKQAVLTAVKQPMTVITGGPGTGKTSIQRALLSLYQKLYPHSKIVCCAPTGRAARKMQEVSGVPATTLHKALGLWANDDGTYRQECQILDANLVLIDEASMIDLPLFYHLVRSLPLDCQLVVIGDVDQLESIGPGAVLRDLIQSRCVPVVRLTHVFRQQTGSRIALNANAIKNGSAALDHGPDFVLYESSDWQQSADLLESLYLKEINAYGLDNVTLLSPFRKKTATGVNELNLRIQQHIQPTRPGEIRHGMRVFRPGDKVMQTQNREEISNGDIGYVKTIEMRNDVPTLVVEFATGLSQAYSGTDLDILDLAYATTVHKSQGSEYDCVLLSLQTGHYPMLTRSLLYTAVTRAKKKVIIVGNQSAVNLAVHAKNDAVRCTALAARMQEQRRLSWQRT